MGEYLLEMFGVSLVLTVLIELLVIFLFLHFRFKGQPPGAENGSGQRQSETSRRGMVRILFLSVPVNVLTNPPAVLLCWLGRIYLGQGMALPVQLAVEALVVAVEAWVYCSFAKKPGWEVQHPAGMAAAANVSSYVIGELLKGLVL